ncbi:MAG: sigma-70 family RNA polymerase sigma factor [Bacteroidia bacterium]|nr:sigma-70 family RNA polymerase sigma factor [Bacteroidia bacterium]
MKFFNLSNDGPEIDPKGFPQAEFIAAVLEGGIAMERMTTELIDYFKGYQWKFWRWYKLEKEEAIDAYTDAVMGLIRYIRLGKFDPQYSVSTYLYLLTKNKCIDHLRKNGRGQRLEKDPIPETLSPEGSQDPFYEILLSEAFDALMDVLETFRGKCREIILKWGYWGYSMTEIAAALGFKNAEVVRTQKSRCLKQLEEVLGNDPEFPTPKLN